MGAPPLLDEALAEKLRVDNIDQFNILVKMHLSFLLDLTTDENDCITEKGKIKRWKFVPFGKKPRGRGIMEGAPLTHEGICVIYQLIEYLKKETNIITEGIFRRTGSLNRQQELRTLLNQGLTLALENGPYTVHDCASVLKGFLAELPEPLLTEAHHSAYCQIAECYSSLDCQSYKERMVTTIQLLLLLLPSENRILLKDVLELLNFTASYEGQNKMSANSLATLFTPHLLCPRKLSPEILHSNSQRLCTVLAFMITEANTIFKVPVKLAMDIRAFYKERERRKVLSPKKMFDESVSDNFAANTVFSFVDIERTAKENLLNPTETALAQLYAHIQSMPESSKKKKLIKQFNRENGCGTPLQVLRSSAPKQKLLGGSIKRHLLQKGLVKSIKKSGLAPIRSSSEEILNSPQQSTSRTRLFCTNCDSSSDISTEDLTRKIVHISDELLTVSNMSDETAFVKLKRNKSESDLSSDDGMKTCSTYITSTPTVHVHRCPMNVTPKNPERKSISPITRSTQRMSRAMQETMMTPRSRKPVLLISVTNINKLPKLENSAEGNVAKELSVIEDDHTDSENENSQIIEKDQSNSATDSQSSLTSTFREYLYSRSMLTTIPTDLSFSSQTDDYTTDVQDMSSSKFNSSLLHFLDGNNSNTTSEGKELVLKPKQFDENGQPTVYETSF